jgi:hypothetical protein
MVSEDLRDMAETYPAAWIEEAIHVAVKNNVRKLKYVLAVLEGMRTGGHHDQATDDAAEPDLSRYDDYLRYQPEDGAAEPEPDASPGAPDAA